MNALTDAEVGKFLNQHCVASYQKVGTFKIVNGQKQGGNIAAYFCQPDGQVLHAIAGPVDAATLLREARWVVDGLKMARFQAGDDPAKLETWFSQAHADRLRAEYGAKVNLARIRDNCRPESFVTNAPCKGLNNQGQVHLLLASFPLVKIDKVYRVVFEKILGEKISTLPVVSG